VSDSIEVFTRSAEEIKTATRERPRGRVHPRRHGAGQAAGGDGLQGHSRAPDRQPPHGGTSEKAKEVAADLARATETQRALSSSISGAVDSLRGSTEENSRVVASLNSSSATMSELSHSLRNELSVFRLGGEEGASEGKSP